MAFDVMPAKASGFIDWKFSGAMPEKKDPISRT